ncbi:MAG: bifunctional oligoribonuclease/PAP phosphatase NrnA [Ignavibacteriales bacterium]|nr:bifunctional oligoribonuclease/PAP phosphatase NrnA [Ignavibacteriales bacterium]
MAPPKRSPQISLSKEFEAFRKVLKTKKQFVLATHVNPDGDGIGSELALAAFLKARGKDVSILNHSATPLNYMFLDPRRDVQTFNPEKHGKMIEQADVIIVLDTNHPDRLVSMKEPVLRSKAYKICVDHHLDPAEFADLYLIDEPATATGETVYRLVTHLDAHAITKEIAVSLYAAIMTDTGSFRYPKTDPEVHMIISRLIKRGADPVEIYENVYEKGSPGRLKLLGQALANIQVIHGGTVAYLVITRSMLSETGTTEVDTDAFVPYTLSVGGIRIGMMFTELDDGLKINFRSKGDIAINELAKEFGGNGHKNAAGARLQDTRLQDVLPKVLERSAYYSR